MRLSFTVPGEAVPQGSHKGFVVRTKTGQTRAVVTSDNKRMRPWRALVASAALDAQSRGDWPVVSDQAIRIDIDCYFIRPKSVPAKKRPHHTVTPDADKCARAILDSLTTLLFRDDAQVVALSIAKHYALPDEPAHVVVRVMELPPPERTA